MDNNTKNIAGRRSERARAFQVLYRLFFSAAVSNKDLANMFNTTYYAAPVAGEEYHFEKDIIPQDADLPQDPKDAEQQENALWVEILHSRENSDNDQIISPDTTEEPQESYAWRLVSGVWGKKDEIDKTIKEFSQNWRLERMGKVELSLLRIAFYELLYRDDIPPKVVINEAIELSKLFGDDNSRSFVNGILDATVKAVEDGNLKRQSVFWG